MPKSVLYLVPRWALISCIAVFVVFAGMGIRLVFAQFTEPTCDPKATNGPAACNTPGLWSAILSNNTGSTEQTILTPLTIGGTTPRDLSLYGNLKMLSPNTSIIRSETLTGKAIDVGSLDNFTINASSSGSGKYALFANGVGSTGGVMAKTDSGKAIEAISTGTGLAALLQGAVQIGSDTTSGETTIGTQANNANLNVYGDILVNGKLFADSGSVVQKFVGIKNVLPGITKEFLPSELFGTTNSVPNNYTLTSFKAYSADYIGGGVYSATWNPVAAGEVWYVECNELNATPVFKIYVKNNSGTVKNFRVGYTYNTTTPVCAYDITSPTATLAPTAAAGPYINAAEQSASFPVVASLTTNASPASPAVVGDTFELLLGGVAFPTPLTRVLTAADITAGSYTFSVTAGQLGTDGLKLLTSKVTDIAGNIGVASPALSLTLDTAAPTTCSISTPVNSSNVAGLTGVSVDATDTYGISKVEFYNDTNTLFGTDTSNPYNASFNTTIFVPSLTIPHTLTAKCYDVAGNSPATSSAISVYINNTGVLCQPPTGARCGGNITKCCNSKCQDVNQSCSIT